MKIFVFEEVTLLSKVKHYWTVIYLNRASLLWMITTLAFENEGRPLHFFFFFFECRPLQGWNEPTRCDTICDVGDDMHANTFFKQAQSIMERLICMFEEFIEICFLLPSISICFMSTHTIYFTIWVYLFCLTHFTASCT